MSPEKLISQATSSLYDGDESHMPMLLEELIVSPSWPLATQDHTQNRKSPPTLVLITYPAPLSIATPGGVSRVLSDPSITLTPSEVPDATILSLLVKLAHQIPTFVPLSKIEP
jgi:hypothetical protein